MRNSHAEQVLDQQGMYRDLDVSAYPMPATTHDCEEKKASEWRGCARLPIARMEVSTVILSIQHPIIIMYQEPTGTGCSHYTQQGYAAYPVRSAILEGSDLSLPNSDQPLVWSAELRWRSEGNSVVRSRRGWMRSMPEDKLRPCDENDACKTAHCQNVKLRSV